MITQMYNKNSVSRFFGLSTDTKPTDCPNGSKFYEINTGKKYYFDKENTLWREFSGGSGGTTDYTDLANKPSINNVPLVGNKTLSDLGLVNPIIIKGRVNTTLDLPVDAEEGWMYFVGLATDTELKEYVYTTDSRWEFVGYNNIVIDTAMSTTSENPVQNKIITEALNGLADDISNLRTLLDSKIQYGTGVELTATQDNPIDLDTIATVGTYFATSGDLTYITNAPFAPNGILNPIRLDVIALASGRRQQIVRPTGGSGDVFVRNNLSGTWGAWRNLNTFGLAQGIATGADLNDYTIPGVYYCNAATSSGLSNNPYTGGAIKLYVEYLNSDSRYIQKLIPSKSDTFQIFYRQYTDRGWGSWYLFEGTAVSSSTVSNTGMLTQAADTESRSSDMDYQA